MLKRNKYTYLYLLVNIYLFIILVLDESVIGVENSEKSHDRKPHPWAERRRCQPVTLFVYSCWRDVGRVWP